MNSTKKSLYRFILFYVASTMAILIAFSVLFFEYQKRVFLDTQRKSLKLDADKIAFYIQQKQLDKIKSFKNLKYALYNRRKVFIDGNFNATITKWKLDIKKVGNSLQMVYLLPPPSNMHMKHNFLQLQKKHIFYLVIKKSIDYTIIDKLIQKILLTLSIAFILLVAIGYFLGKLFIRPMKQTIKQLNEFVQDATHELNTPISTILNNIEMMEILHKCQDAKELKRVKVASKTLSKIYEDLSYTKLNHNIQRDLKELNISQLLQERLEYFKLLIDSKKIVLTINIEPNITKKADKRDITRVFDNLISNAIKYNKNGGTIEINLNKDKFLIKDSGIGIDKNRLKDIFDRFKRANNSEGGFGLGLSIIKEICNFYGYKVNIDSKEGVGSEITVWFNTN